MQPMFPFDIDFSLKDLNRFFPERTCEDYEALLKDYIDIVNSAPENKSRL